MPMRWAQLFFGYKYKFQLAIFKDDGTIAITHGGIEMGQGLNTKVVQVAAKELRVSPDLITVKASNAFIGNNSTATGGSYGSELLPLVRKLILHKKNHLSKAYFLKRPPKLLARSLELKLMRLKMV